MVGQRGVSVSPRMVLVLKEYMGDGDVEIVAKFLSCHVQHTGKDWFIKKGSLIRNGG